MHITTTEVEGITIAEFEGNLDTNTAPDAEERLGELLEKGVTKILVDFTTLNYISSAGLRVLLVTTKRLGGAGGSMRLCGLNECSICRRPYYRPLADFPAIRVLRPLPIRRIVG